jgi:hypothetical protein
MQGAPIPPSPIALGTPTLVRIVLSNLPLECGGLPPLLRLHAGQQSTTSPPTRRFLFSHLHPFF